MIERTSFREFQKSRRYVECIATALDSPGIVANNTPGFIYMDSYYIERWSSERCYYLCIANYEGTSDSLTPLERRLWDGMACAELNGLEMSNA